MSVRVTWPQALAWRMRRQLLDPVGSEPMDEVVRRLCGVQAQVPSSAELAVRIRRRTSRPDEIADALAQGHLIRTWAMRGSIHLLAPDTGGAFLSLMAAARSWERPSWQRAFGMSPDGMNRLRDAVRAALDGRTLTREELVSAVATDPGLADAAEGLRSGWGTLLKPLAWQGELCFGPSQGTRVTFMRPEAASSRWAGLPDPDEAAPLAIAAYLRAYAPAIPDAFSGWLSGGWFGKRQLRAWFAALGQQVAEVEVDGASALALAEDLDELAKTEPTEAVRLLPGFDQYVLGPGTADGHVTPETRRSAVSRQSGWISPVVVVGGRVRGTWELEGDEVRVAWFAEEGRPPRRPLQAEVDRLASILDRSLVAEVSLA
jgi:hypothetical protein